MASFQLSPIRFARGGKVEIVSGSDRHGLGIFLVDSDSSIKPKFWRAFDFKGDVDELGLRQAVESFNSDSKITYIEKRLSAYKKYELSEHDIRNITGEFNLTDKIDGLLSDIDRQATDYSQYECGLPCKDSGSYEGLVSSVERFLLENRDLIEEFYASQDNDASPR